MDVLADFDQFTAAAATATAAAAAGNDDDDDDDQLIVVVVGGKLQSNRPSVARDTKSFCSGDETKIDPNWPNLFIYFAPLRSY